MRTNFAGFFLAAGMGLIVMLLGLGALSMAGLVSFVTVDTQDAPSLSRDDVPVATLVTVRFDTTTIPASAKASFAAGDALFSSNCAQCHAVNEKIVGPALAGLTKRRSTDWIVSWVHNSAKVIASGDEYGVKLFNDNGKQQMPSFSMLSEKEIEDIITWISLQDLSAQPDACHCLM